MGSLKNDWSIGDCDRQRVIGAEDCWSGVMNCLKNNKITIILMIIVTLFRTILSFCWPGNVLVQCRENLCNDGAAFTATRYYQKINWVKIKIAEKWCYSDKIALSFFLCNVLWSLLDNMAQGFLSYFVQCFPKKIKTALKMIFLVQCCL